MTKKKGVQNIIDLAPLLLEKYKNLLFLMIGDGPLREKLERIVEKSGLSNNFYFTGEISREKVLGYLEQADIFALPSTNEAFGVSILEAISRKVPVVAMNNSGVSDIIKNGINGYLADSLEEFLFYLENLIETPALRTSLLRKLSGGSQTMIGIGYVSKPARYIQVLFMRNITITIDVEEDCPQCFQVLEAWKKGCPSYLTFLKKKE